MPVRVGSSEGLGAAALGLTATRWEAPPGQDHQQGEHCVGHREYPERSLVVDEPLDPVLNEALVIRRSAGLDTKPGFQRCERAILPQPCLDDNNGNGCEMCQPKPPAVDPAPAEPVSCHNHDKACHDEEHDSEVDEENGIR
jgi:hypothetical protein